MNYLFFGCYPTTFSHPFQHQEFRKKLFLIAQATSIVEAASIKSKLLCWPIGINDNKSADVRINLLPMFAESKDFCFFFFLVVGRFLLLSCVCVCVAVSFIPEFPLCNKGRSNVCIWRPSQKKIIYSIVSIIMFVRYASTYVDSNEIRFFLLFSKLTPSVVCI